MLKKLLIPCFVFAAAVVGCSSNDNNKPAGTAGTSGGAAGTTGTAGSTAGTTGTAGSTAGTTGTAGSTAGTTGTAGTGGTTGTAGTGGTTGTAGTGGTTGTGGTGGGTAGTTGTGGTGTDAGTDATAAIPACPTADKMMATASKVDKVTFCKNFLSNCSGLETADTAGAAFTIPDAYNTEEKCEAAWDANTTAPICRTYHLCGNAVGKDEGSRRTHCPHAVGMGGVCTSGS